MAEWLEQVSQWHKMYCRDLDVIDSNPSQVELGVRSSSVQILLEPEIYFHYI